MALPDLSDIKIGLKNGLSTSIRQLSHRGLRDGMKRWTNGLPGATTRLGAKMALRGLSPSEPGCARILMMVRSKICSTKRPDTLMQLSRSSLLEIRLATRGRAGTECECRNVRYSAALGGSAEVIIPAD
jgi:hypothetical protein